MAQYNWSKLEFGFVLFASYIDVCHLSELAASEGTIQSTFNDVNLEMIPNQLIVVSQQVINLI
jgi:hypothetical protein